MVLNEEEVDQQYDPPSHSDVITIMIEAQYRTRTWRNHSSIGRFRAFSNII